MFKRNNILLFVILCCTILTSCSITKYVPDGQYLLNKTTINVDTKEVKTYDLQTYLRQSPNTKLFDIAPFNLSLYSLSSPDTALWINRFLRKIGDAPVIYDSTLTIASEVELKKYMANKGFYDAKVSSATKYKKKKANVTYNIVSGRPYTINNYKYAILDSTLKQLVMSDSVNSLIKKGDNFDTDVLEQERIRITHILRDNGYYDFDREYIAVVADSTIGNHKVDVALFIRPMKVSAGDGTFQLVRHEKYKVNSVTYYGLKEATNLFDTTQVNNLKKKTYKDITLYENAKVTRPDVLYRKSFLEADAPYNESAVDKTYSKLSSLQTFKYQNIYFEVSDSAKKELDCKVILTPDKVQSISAQIEGTNNEGDLGIAGKISYTHGNLFNGGEQFKFSLGGGNESLITKRSIWNLQTEAALKFPMLLCPFLSRDQRRNTSANTEVYLNFSYQTRQEYSRIILGTGLRYQWTSQKRLTHQLELVDFNYVHLPFMSDDFKKTISSSILKYSYEDHLIMRIGYTISYTTQQQNSTSNNYSVRAGVETGGNLLYGICVAAKAPKSESGSYIIGDIPFAQYAKVDFDFCYRHVIDTKNTVAYHIGIGAGIPYLNSTTLPFEKRYYGGGANSVRGWSARSLGPGNYAASENIDYMKQSGDFSLNLNVEYRAKLFWKLELAAFLDAGNIWTWMDEGQAEGQFKIDRFYKQIAFGYGIGLRLNFDIFVIRLDWGLKAFDPSKAAGEQWRFVPGWSITKDTALHLAVGYPF